MQQPRFKAFLFATATNGAAACMCERAFACVDPTAVVNEMSGAILVVFFAIMLCDSYAVYL